MTKQGFSQNVTLLLFRVAFVYRYVIKSDELVQMFVPTFKIAKLKISLNKSPFQM
ncbi:hypothetical protein [Hugenholtzia roseola]|uniref:hypothetical protein n=1 Tax=Hugenholtzia roseola TaxID=1002 RepID=UPI0013789F53|nr:hypothetical protein [Hugenholtzia roseola]